MKSFFVVVSLILISFTLQAKDADLLSSAKTKAAVISGVLAPASLSFNGQEIEQSSESYEALLLNGQEVSITEVGGLKTFYLSVDKSSIDLKWKKASGETKAILKIDYPAVEEMRLLNNDIVFKFNTVTTDAVLDTKNIKIVDSAFKYPIENLSQWLADVHTLELTSAQKSSQMYNIDFQDQKSDLLTNKTWTLYHGNAPFYSSGDFNVVGLGYRKQDENLRSWEFVTLYGKKTYNQCCYYFNGSPADNIVEQSVLEFKTRYGYNPFSTNFGDFSFKRLTVGLQGEVFNYRRHSTFQSYFDGYNTDEVDQWFINAGLFFRWEPLQYGQFGFSINVDFNLHKSQLQINRDSDIMYLGLSYTY